MKNTVVAGLDLAKNIDLSLAFYQTGNFDGAYGEAFSPEVDLLEMSFHTDASSRKDLYQVLEVLC